MRKHLPRFAERITSTLADQGVLSFNGLRSRLRPRTIKSCPAICAGCAAMVPSREQFCRPVRRFSTRLRILGDQVAGRPKVKPRATGNRAGSKPDCLVGR